MEWLLLLGLAGMFILIGANDTDKPERHINTSGDWSPGPDHYRHDWD